MKISQCRLRSRRVIFAKKKVTRPYTQAVFDKICGSFISMAFYQIFMAKG